MLTVLSSPRVPARTALSARTTNGRRRLTLACAAALVLTALGACARADAIRRDDTAPAVDGHLFTRLPSTYTGVTFANRPEDTPEFNVFTYRNAYNGGGVALGDLTGDGLPEIVLTSNQGGARLYLNEGHFRFRDVTEAAGLRNRAGTWTTGVTIADVNGDGRLDVYVCHAGMGTPAERANELYINQGPGPDGVPRFTEEAAAYGLADGGYSTQAVFFDYDRDGRLDLFLLRNSPKPVTSFGTRNTRGVRDPWGGAKLYHNDGASTPGAPPHFTDVSEHAGIFSPENAFGLGVVAADVDRDGWPDLYTSSDYYERDYLYLNNHDGTFREVLPQTMAVDSYFSMGLDVADVNNDGWPDVYTTDMLPDDEHRLKTTSSYEGWDTYQEKVRTGYHHQLMRNMLQLNAGAWGGEPGSATGLWFADVAQIAGVARTDWSWGALAVDLDLDGYKDLFVTNGVAKDVTNQDYIAYIADEETMRAVTAGGKVDFMRLLARLKANPVPNYALRNLGGEAGAGGVPRFVNHATAWGLDTPSLSNGAAYADLDGDGAPDLVVNNIDAEAFVYRNNARTLTPANHYLQLRLTGEGGNPFGIGAKITVLAGGRRMYQELSPTRGFQSSSDYRLTFGLGAATAADTVAVEWLDGRVNVLTSVRADQLIAVRHAQSTPAWPALGALGRVAMGDAPAVRPVMRDVSASVALDYAHHENDFIDFDRDRLIPKLLSTEGPVAAVGDVNGDGLDDLYLGGAKGQAGQLMLQTPDGHFVRSSQAVFDADSTSEDVGAVFFDADGDGRPDLYVVSGGNEFAPNSPLLQDRLYLNVGGGRFRKATGALPVETNVGSRVVAADYDGDGATDLFVGGRMVPLAYGVPPRSMLLHNDGHGHFTDVTEQLAPELAHVGMVTDAVWQDVDGDGRLDLVVVGEWMPITVFHNVGGGRLVKMALPALAQSHGWWNRIIAGDFSGHGRVDFLVGNLGLNSRLRASLSEPTTMLVKDFGHNDYIEQIVSTFNHGVSYPITLRDDLLRALPFLRARIPSYEAYASKTVNDVFTTEERAGAVADTAYTFATTLMRNDGPRPDGTPRYTLVPLPAPAQLAPVYGMLAGDVEGRGKLDVLLAGNFDGFRPDIGRMAASRGLLLRVDSSGAFAPVSSRESGFVIPGQVRDIQRVRTRAGPLYLVLRNNDRPLLFRATPAERPHYADAGAPRRARAVP